LHERAGRRGSRFLGGVPCGQSSNYCERRTPFRPARTLTERPSESARVRHAPLAAEHERLRGRGSDPAGWIAFTYDGSDRITQATDNLSRTVGYQYDASGRLWKVTDVNGGVTEYTCDSSHRC